MPNEITTRSQNVALQPQHSFADLQRMAEAVAKSGLFGVKTPEAALTLMLIAQEEGTGVAAACRDFHVIEGHPSLKADAMLARFQKAGGMVEWHRLDNLAAEATFTAPHGRPLKLDWTIEQARTAGLVRTNRDGSPGMWMKYPRAMLRSRLVSEGIRTVAPETIVGVYTPEELRDEPEMRDITPPRDPSTPPAARAADEITDVGPEPEPGGGAPPADASATPPTLSAKEVADHEAAIAGASTLEELRRCHATGYKRAHEIGDTAALARLAQAKNKAKIALQRVAGAKVQPEAAA